jgi:hypothetical protein
MQYTDLILSNLQVGISIGADANGGGGVSGNTCSDGGDGGRADGSERTAAEAEAA